MIEVIGSAWVAQSSSAMGHGKRHQMREIKTGGGFHSYDAPIAHFGLGKYKTIHQIEIT